MVTVAIHQPQYLPYLGFFHKLNHCDVLVVLDNVEFPNRGVQNRNKIKTKDGWQWLTVPVIQKRGQLIQDVKIENSIPWQARHRKALVTNYSRAPYFIHYADELQTLLTNPVTDLVTLDMILVGWAMRALGIQKPIFYASQLDAPGKQTEHLIQLCRAVQADCYLSGQGGRNYMDLNAFDAAGIRVQWQSFTPPEYPQVFPAVGFIPNLSVVDALFACGADAARFVN